MKYLGLILFCGVMVMTSCKQESPYKKMLREGLESGIDSNRVILDIELGMFNKDFFDYCKMMNNKTEGKLTQGRGGNNLKYPIESLKDIATVHFYPKFHENHIYEIPMSFSYDAWAPWNKELSGENLLEDVKGLMEKWYGSGFIGFKDPLGGKGYVKVDGNRRVTIFNKDTAVEVTVTDMKMYQEREKQGKL